MTGVRTPEEKGITPTFVQLKSIRRSTKKRDLKKAATSARSFCVFLHSRVSVFRLRFAGTTTRGRRSPRCCARPRGASRRKEAGCRSGVANPARALLGSQHAFLGSEKPLLPGMWRRIEWVRGCVGGFGAEGNRALFAGENSFFRKRYFKMHYVSINNVARPAAARALWPCRSWRTRSRSSAASRCRGPPSRANGDELDFSSANQEKNAQCGVLNNT